MQIVIVALGVGVIFSIFSLLPVFTFAGIMQDGVYTTQPEQWYSEALEFWHHYISLAPLFSSWIPIGVIGWAVSTLVLVIIVPLITLGVVKMALNLFTGGGFRG